MNSMYSFRPFQGDIGRACIGLLSCFVSGISFAKLIQEGKVLFCVLSAILFGLSIALIVVCLISYSAKVTLSAEELTMRSRLLRVWEKQPTEVFRFGYFTSVHYKAYLVLSPRKMDQGELQALLRKVSIRPFFYRFEGRIILYVQNANREKISRILQERVLLQTCW